MNIKSRIALTVLSAALCTEAAGFSASVGAAAEVQVIDGVATAFVSSFGKMSYGGAARQTYKTVDEAISALESHGGREGKIIIQGNAGMSGFGENLRDYSLTLEGVGAKASGNTVKVSEQTISLPCDVVFSNICLQMPENGAVVTNGNSFSAINGFDSYHTERYISSGNTEINYPSPISVIIGQSESADDGEVCLKSGKYKDISVCPDGKGDALLNLDGVSAERLIVEVSDGCFEADGSVYINILNAEIGTLTYGTGSLNGILNVNIGDSASIGSFEASDSLKVSGKKIAAVGEKGTSAVPNGAFDIVLKVSGGMAEAVVSGKSLDGFEISDTHGFNCRKVMLDGDELAAENGIFKIPDGIHTVTAVPSVNIALNSDAVYVKGYDDGTFLPQNNMTRAEAITTLSRIIADESEFADVSSAEYGDVAESDWYSPYIGLFQKLGYLDTLEKNGNILPKNNITRGEFCELISKIYPIVSKKYISEKTFSDVDEKYPYARAVGLAGFTGIVGGYEDGTFRPDNLITRAEVVTMINRMIGRTPADNDAVIFSDTNGHWARTQINSAANEAESGGIIMWTKSEVNKFNDYMQYRSGLANTRAKLKNDKKLSVGFIGGSVTAGAGASNANETSWRARIVDWFRNTYPECEINEVNAAIGDSYTKYAVYRMDNDLLKYDYDIVFVEYAINDSPWYSAKQDDETIIYFETLIRRIYEHNPNADIVIAYTIDDKISRIPKYFPTAAAQEVIAAHYDIPSVNFGRALADYVAENNFKWDDWFSDYVHPNDKGYMYYAAVMSEYLENALKPGSDESVSSAAKALPAKHTEKELWYNLTMLEADEIDLSLSKNWALSEDGKKIYPTDADNELVIKTYGSDICIASPRDDLMYYSVDGGAEQHMKMNRKPQTLAEGLSDGEHTLRIRAEDIKKLSIQRIMYNGKKG